MNDLNFFKPYQGKVKAKTDFKMYIYAVAGAVGVLILGTLIFNTARIYLLDKDITTYKTKLADQEIQKELKEAENINNQINVLKKYDNSLIDVAKSVKQRNNVSDILLKEISSTVPSEVSFKILNMKENMIILQGISTNRVAIAELKHNLSELSNMQDVYVNSIDNKGAVEDEYSFDIKCVLKDVE